MAEWLKAAVLKTVNGETRSGVRIPLPPPSDSALTLAAIGILAYVSCDLLHELAGALNQIMNARLAITLAVSTTLGSWGFLLVPLFLLTSRTAPATARAGLRLHPFAVKYGVSVETGNVAHYFGCGMMFTIRYSSFRMRK
jgi:hypothetical protein